MANDFLKLASELFLGKRIVKIEYMSLKEARDFGWDKRPIVIMLEDGTEIYPQMDDEGNNGGVLAVYNSGYMKSNKKSYYTVFPVFGLYESED
jgi:hypothetical protein